ncbi:Uncharacterized protein TCM_013664 [Theobroma cacao]|uniref:Uncharacterized protein n=1 Tax=Theobroma cacao TaxID=3641 RepID=A0A061FWM9_THECC|nr:Uncharacterized protein TCM_013664 [Theobroma cacao]
MFVASKDGGFALLVIFICCAMMMYDAYKVVTLSFALAMRCDMMLLFAAAMRHDMILYVVCRLATVRDYVMSREDHSMICIMV